MSDLDLIPASWRDGRSKRRALARFGFAYAALALLIAAVTTGLGLRIKAESEVLERLRGDKHSALAERARLDTLEDRRGTLERELRTLDRLGGAAGLTRLFDTVERSLSDEVWFREWVFMRAGEFVEVGPRTVETGYLILVPDSSAGQGRRGWRLSTHMEIRGQALSHSALAAFVRRLAASPGVEEVKILDTRSQTSDGAEVVGFELAVVMRDGSRGA